MNRCECLTVVLRAEDQLSRPLYALCVVLLDFIRDLAYPLIMRAE